MVQRSPFGVRLWRLLASRRPTIETMIDDLAAELAARADVPYAELAAVIKGAEPEPELVRRLAPALGLHTADLFVIAGLAVPLDLASAWPTAPWGVGTLIPVAAGLDAEQRGRLGELVRSMPVHPRTELAPEDDYPEGPGALLLRLLRNRNIRPHSAKTIAMVAGAPYVSDSTIAMLGTGQTTMTAEFVTAFAHVLGFAPADMVAVTGIGPAIPDGPAHRASAELAALAWSARRLTGEQLSAVISAGYAMR